MTNVIESGNVVATAGKALVEPDHAIFRHGEERRSDDSSAERAPGSCNVGRRDSRVPADPSLAREAHRAFDGSGEGREASRRSDLEHHQRPRREDISVTNTTKLSELQVLVGSRQFFIILAAENGLEEHRDFELLEGERRVLLLFEPHVSLASGARLVEELRRVGPITLNISYDRRRPTLVRDVVDSLFRLGGVEAVLAALREA